MDLRHLRHFVTVAEELHFGRAAARLRIAQPPLSRSVKELEQEVGATLLLRDTRSVALTPAGKVMLKEARETLARAAYALEATRRAARSEATELRVGYLGGPGAAVIPAALTAFRKKHPDITLAAIEMNSADVANALERGELDTAFVAEPDANGPLGALRYAPVVRYPLRIVMNTAHRLAKKPRLGWDDLHREKFLVYSRAVAPAYRDWIVSLCRARGFDPRIAAETPSPTALLTGVATGDGLAFILPTYARWAPPEILFKPIHPPPPPEEFGLVFAGHAPKRAADAWLAILRDTAKHDGLADGGPHADPPRKTGKTAPPIPVSRKATS